MKPKPMVTGQGNNPRFIDDTLSREQLSDYHLSIQLCPAGASYAVTDTLRNVVIAVHERKVEERLAPEALLSDLLKDPLLQQPDFHSVSLGVSGVPSTLTPSSLDKEACADLLKFSFGQVAGPYFTQEIPALGANMVYALNESVRGSLQGAFPQARIYSSDALLIDSVLRKTRSTQGPHLYVDCVSGFTTYFLTRGKDFLFYNWFRTENEFDVLYHSMNVCHQWDIAEQDVQINLSGEVDPAGVHFRLLKEHFKKVDINFGLDFHKMGLGLSRVRRQRHLGLLNQYVCVS